MAGKNGKSRVNRQQLKKKNQRRRTRQSPNSTGFGGLLARGVRTLLSVLPGSKLTTGIADFVFKSLGYSTTSSIHPDGTVSAEFQCTGLCALFHVALKDILVQSFTHGTRVNSSEWESNYFAGRLKSMCVRLTPQTPQSDIQGMLSIAFIPFRSDEESKFYNNKSNIQGLQYEQVKLIPGAKSGRAGKPLSIYYKPKASDGRLNYDIGMNEEIGAVLIGFEQMSRTSYTVFGADEFACSITLSGVVELQRPREAGQPGKFSRKLDDKMADNKAIILSPCKSLQYTIFGGDYPIEFRAESIFVRGNVSEEHKKQIVAYLSGDLQDAIEKVSV